MWPFKKLRIIALRRRANGVLREFHDATGHESARFGQDDFETLEATYQDAFDGVPSATVGDSNDSPLSAEVKEEREQRYAEELVHIEQLQKERPSWANAIAFLIISLGVFLATGVGAWKPGLLLLEIPILLFHELGHFVGMWAFKYRNMRMFFIPLFGAAVAGRHYNVPGWKKAVVSLLGPVPGIVLGSILAFAAVGLDVNALLPFALFMLVLNGINLLPVLPLDGGWIAHAILFSRHYLLDGAFRSLAGCLLIALGYYSGSFLWAFIGVCMFAGLPLSYKLAKIVGRLRTKIPAQAPDDQKIPVQTSCLILDELKNALPKMATAQTRARCTLQVF